MSADSDPAAVAASPEERAEVVALVARANRVRGRVAAVAFVVIAAATAAGFLSSGPDKTAVIVGAVAALVVARVGLALLRGSALSQPACPRCGAPMEATRFRHEKRRSPNGDSRVRIPTRYACRECGLFADVA